ncbi:MAG: DUF934 domain-containing protein [Geminicoccaceae bacterium]
MPLLKGQTIVEDVWTRVADDQPIPADGAVIVTLERLEAEAEHLWHRPDGIGVELRPEQPVERLEPWLARLRLVALRFPGFADGRAFSTARILRTRYRYEGEVRATGNVLVDQRQFMLQCGFDSFEVAEGRALQAWLSARVQMPLTYQVGYEEQAGHPALAVFAARHSRPEALAAE